jgi:hypothetical protein
VYHPVEGRACEDIGPKPKTLNVIYGYQLRIKNFLTALVVVGGAETQNYVEQEDGIDNLIYYSQVHCVIILKKAVRQKRVLR